MNDTIHNQDENKKLRQALLDLDWNVEPDSDLWSAISSEIRVNKRSVKSFWVPLSIAASVAILAVSLSFSFLSYQHSLEFKKELQAMSTYQESQLAIIEQQHQIVRSQFTKFMHVNRNLINPRLLTEVETAMTDIDEAAMQLKSAISAQPNKTFYASKLVSTYQQEIKLFNRISNNQGISL